ncbi:hypothetical protein B4079_5818 [Bacillus cereus]|nr:hypothetical protein B4079_5818 [Bacillus cereus]
MVIIKKKKIQKVIMSLFHKNNPTASKVISTYTKIGSSG